MTKSEMQFAIYTDYYRIGGTEFGFKELLKVWLNRNILAGFRVMYFTGIASMRVKKTNCCFDSGTAAIETYQSTTVWSFPWM